jgi:hypothetical protein
MVSPDSFPSEDAMFFRQHLVRSLGLIPLFALLALSSARGQGDATKWVNLLEGGDLTKNWFTTGNWKLASNGEVALEPREGEKGWQRYDAYLWAKKQYKDFEADFEYKVAEKGNSGFYFHVGNLKQPVATGIEVQIYDSPSKKAGSPLTDHDSGGIIPGIPPIKNAAKPAGEWNRMQVSCKDGKIKVLLNGELVNDVSLDNPKIKDRPPTGSIGFQDHGLPLWLRNIRVREQ